MWLVILAERQRQGKGSVQFEAKVKKDEARDAFDFIRYSDLIASIEINSSNIIPISFTADYVHGSKEWTK